MEGNWLVTVSVFKAIRKGTEFVHPLFNWLGVQVYASLSKYRIFMLFEKQISEGPEAFCHTSTKMLCIVQM